MALKPSELKTRVDVSKSRELDQQTSQGWSKKKSNNSTPRTMTLK